MSASYPTKLLLAFRSGDICALPGCGKALSVDGVVSASVILGEAAHVEGENEDSARYNPAQTDAERDHYKNLIYLCNDCHTRIDKQAADFPVAKLQLIKQQHEAKVRDALADAFADIGFPELEIATKWASIVTPSRFLGDFSVLVPEAKLKKNNLSNVSRGVIAMGLGVAHEVKSFVESCTQTDPDFPERLKAGFLSQYFKFKREGSSGDELFDLMCKFAQQGFLRQSEKSAGIAVLVYLFEACEVFEK